MVVLLVERVPDGLRGALRRWMLEVQPGTFVGRLSQRVREELWKRVAAQGGPGAAVLLWTARNEQGYEIEVWGQPDRRVLDFDGLQLVARPRKDRKEKSPGEEERA